MSGETTIDIGAVSRAAALRVKAQDPKPVAPSQPADDGPLRELTPRQYEFRVGLEDPSTGRMVVVPIVSRVPEGTDHDLIARYEASWAAPFPVEAYPRDVRAVWRDRARCFVQIRNRFDDKGNHTDVGKVLDPFLWGDPAVTATLAKELYSHEDTFRPADRRALPPSGGEGPPAEARPRVVVYAGRAAHPVPSGPG